MDITDMKSFLAVVEYRSFTLAAKKVHITQSAMSKRIQKIENELGIRLFIVEGSRVNLTDEATYILPYIRQMLATFESMYTSLKKNSNQFQQHVIAGASVFVSHSIFPDFINFLKTSDASFQVQIRTMSELDIDNFLNHGLVDIVVCHDTDISSKFVVKEDLWKETFYLVSSKNHSLNQKNNFELQDLQKFPGILTDSGSIVRDTIADFFQHQSLNIQDVVEVSTLDSSKSLVEHGVGWSFLPKQLISDDLVIVDEALKLDIPFCAYYLKKRTDERRIQNFLEYFDDWMHPESKKEKILW